MTDGRPDPDDDLARTLRIGFAALEAELGEAPTAPSAPARPGPSTTRARALVAAALVAAAALAGVLAWQTTRSEDPEERVATAPERESGGPSLVGTPWWLVSAVDGDTDVSLGGRMDVGLALLEPAPCDPADGDPDCDPDLGTLTASDACNGVSRTYAVEGQTLVLGRPVGGTTAMACDSPLVTLLGQVWDRRSDSPEAPTEVGWEIEGDRLTVRSSDKVLTYRAGDGPFAPTGGTVVDEGAEGGQRYRLVWGGADQDGGLQLEVADDDVVMARGGSGLGEDPGRINTMRSEVGDRAYLFAIVPAEAARVVYEPVGGTPVDVEVTDVGSATSAVVGTFVDEDPPAWHLVAYASDGLELHRYRWGNPYPDVQGRSLEEVIRDAGYDCCGQDGARLTFTFDGIPMTAASSPLEPTEPRDPLVGITGGRRASVDGGEVVVGTVRGRTALRFDCNGQRYEIWADQGQEVALAGRAAPLSGAAGCNVVRVGG